MIRQGEIYWLHFGTVQGSEPAPVGASTGGSDPAQARDEPWLTGRRPALIVQHDRFNRSAISTTVVAAVPCRGTCVYAEARRDFHEQAS